MREPLMSVPRTKFQAGGKSAAVDALFDAWAQGKRPGGAVGIFQGGEPVLKRGYGMANLSTGFSIDSKTPFRLASLTKPFVAMTIMMLEERGALKYSDPIVRFLPEFSVVGERVTVGNLLTHTSGIADYEELFLKAGVIDAKFPRLSQGAPDGSEPSVHETLKLLARQPLRFMPGDEWEYSNSGYVLLASIVERVSGHRLARFLAEHIFEPLDMHDSRLSEHARPEPELSDRAKGYVRENGAYIEADYSPLNALYGPDGIYSTLDDMFKWLAALSNERLVKPLTLEKAFASSELNNGALTGYGFGWFVGKSLDLPFVSHTGSWMGYRSFIVYYPANRFGILVLANCAEFDDAKRSYVANYLSKLYLDIEQPSLPTVRIDEGVLQGYTGSYEIKDGEIFEIELRDGTLFVNSGIWTIKLLPDSRFTFFVEGSNSDTYTFHVDPHEEVIGLTRHLSLYGYSKDAYSWARRLNS